MVEKEKEEEEEEEEEEEAIFGEAGEAGKPDNEVLLSPSSMDSERLEGAEGA